MDALLIRMTFAAAAIASTGATYQSPNFTVTAPTEEMAEQVAKHAEHYRRELAIEWLGHELPNWYAPCPVKVKVGRMGAGGFTSFSFDRGSSGEMEVFGWNMVVQGSLERVLDSVIPHEVSHTILACHFRHPLPRWADEGAATLAEHESEKRRQLLMVNHILHTNQRIPLRKLLSMKEYPSDSQAVLSLYAQGYTLADLLVQQRGKATYLKFLGESEELGWDRAFKKYYGYASVEVLEEQWTSWVEKGCPSLKQPEEPPLLVAENQRRPRSDGFVVRSQTPEEKSGNAKSSGQAGQRDRLEAPRRPKTTVAQADQKPRSNTRIDNQDWVVIRTSGRALPAMATKPISQETGSANTASTSKPQRRRGAGSMSLPVSEIQRVASATRRSHAQNKGKQQQIPANRRTPLKPEFPSRPQPVRRQ